MQCKELRHFSFYVRNIKRALEFYTEILDFKIVASGKIPAEITWVWLEKYSSIEYVKLALPNGKSLLELITFKPPLVDYIPSFQHVSITVKDIWRIYRNMREKGHPSRNAPLADTVGKNKVMFCRDYDDNLLELVEPIKERRK